MDEPGGSMDRLTDPAAVDPVLSRLLETCGDIHTLTPNNVYQHVADNFSIDMEDIKADQDVKTWLKNRFRELLLARSTGNGPENVGPSVRSQTQKAIVRKKGRKGPIEETEKKQGKAATRAKKTGAKKTPTKAVSSQKTGLTKICTLCRWAPAIYKGLNKDDDRSYCHELKNRILQKCSDLKVCAPGRLPTQAECKSWRKEQDLKDELASIGLEGFQKEEPEPAPKRRTLQRVPVPENSNGTSGEPESSEYSDMSSEEETSSEEESPSSSASPSSPSSSAASSDEGESGE